MTKKPNGEGSIFRLPNGKWKATISLGTDRSGKRRRRSKTARSRADAAAFLREMQNESAAGATPEPSRLTVFQFLIGWLGDTIKPRGVETTTEGYRHSIEKHIAPAIGCILLRKIAPIHVQQMFTILQNKGAGARTCQLAHSVLRSALGHAMRLRLIRENPCGIVPKPKANRKQIKPFTADEARNILDLSKLTRFHAITVLAATTGLRQGELFGLHWDRIDLKAGKLRVDQQAVELSGKVIVQRPKTPGSIRTIDLTDMAIEALKAHRVASLKEGNAASLIVFCAREGGYIHRGNFRVRFWKPLLKKAGIDYRGFHHVRHTFATLALGAGVPLHVVSSVLGHAKPATTLNIYSHCLNQQYSAATATIGRLFG